MYGGGKKKNKTVFSHLIWGDRRRYGDVGRKSHLGAQQPITCVFV